MFFFEKKDIVAYCKWGVRFFDGRLEFIPVIVNFVEKGGEGPKSFVRFSLGMGLHDDQSFYRACLVLDVNVAARTKLDIVKTDGKKVCEIAAISSYDINDENAMPKKPFKERKDFTKTWLSIAINFSKQLGCTHLELTDAANIRISKTETQLLSPKNLLLSGKTFYEKYGFKSIEPLDEAFRKLHHLKIKDLSEDKIAKLEKLLPFINRNSSIKDIYNKKDSEESLQATIIVFSHLPDELKSKNEKNFYDLVRGYELDLSEELIFKQICIIEQCHILHLKEKETWPKDFPMRLLENMKKYDNKLDVRD